MKAHELFILISTIDIITICIIAFFWPFVFWSFIWGALILMGGDIFQTQRIIRRNFPLIGHFGYVLEKFLWPEIM